MRRNLIYLTSIALLAMTAFGVWLASDSIMVSAQRSADETAPPTKKMARADMLSIALDLRSASEYSVYAEKGIKNNGSRIKGETGDALRGGDSAETTRGDLAKAFSAINQLPCVELGAELRGGSFEPGVYCATGADLRGAMTLDAANNPNSVFVFRVGGAFKAGADFALNLQNDAQAGNVYFVADEATVESNTNFRGNILATKDIAIKSGATVTGKTISLDGTVTATEASLAPAAPGVLQICKQAVGSETVFEILGVNQSNELVRFRSNAPGTLIGAPIPITGLPDVDDYIRAIDRRPATGEIFGFGTDDRIYRINPNTGVATPVGAAIPNTLPDEFVGFDFNPVVDRIRLNNSQNFRVNPNDGTFIQDTNLTVPAAASAYTNNVNGAVSTTLYTIVGNTDQLYIVNPPNAGTSNLVGSLGVDVGAVNGFDIFGFNDTALFAAAVGNATTSTLFSINLQTGAATSLGAIGAVNQLRGMTIVGSANLGPSGLDNRIFRFRIGANIYEVPVGQCSGPITLEEGNYTIEELLDGRTIPSGTFNGRFRLVDVNSPTPGALGAVNLPLRTANVFIRPGDISNQTIVNFVNQFAITGVIEICKRAVADQTEPFSIQDRDVSGFFDYTIDAIANTVFTVPVGQCSGPIQVNTTTIPQPVPGRGQVLVTELAEPGFTLESVSTFPADRLLSFVPNQGIRNMGACANIGISPIPPACLFSNPRGGYVGAVILEGGAASQTTVNFFNRTNPGRIKVCKIAGPGIPEGTRFEFEVRGWAPNYENPTPVGTNPTAILPGYAVTRRVVVVAGPASQGGFCNFVEGTFIIGSIVNVTELLPPLDPVPGLGPINGVPGDIRVSRIRVSAPSAIISGSLAGRTVSFRARREVVEAEFTNYVFRPTLLKICKIAGPGVAVGTPFNFTVTTDTVGGLFSEGTQTVTVQAGPAAQGGFCQFVNGPYDPTNTVPPIGTYRVGAIVTVTEAAVTGTVLTGVTSPTGTPTVNLPGRSATLTLGFPGGFNELAFTNAAAPVGTLTQRAPFDFDGDNKSDASVYRNGTWTWTRSSNGGQQSVDFGLATDVTAPADFDGDNKTDVAVFRDGTWHILQSSNGQYKGIQFGQAGDIAQPGDFDGDGSADVAVFRPSTGAWYINRSRDGFFGMQFGIATDRAAAGDYDGDGATDIAVYRPSDGAWYIMQSRDGFKAVQFGIASDRIVAADYDGDGRTDPAVYRNGAWYMLRSTAGFGYVQFGVAADRPVPGDYNGDGKADVGVYRDGTWHIMLSGASEATYTSMVLGGGSDSPVPSSYVR